MEQQTQHVAPPPENGLRGTQPPAVKELLKLDFRIEELKPRFEGRISSGVCSVIITSCGCGGGCKSSSCAFSGD